MVCPSDILLKIFLIEQIVSINFIYMLKRALYTYYMVDLVSKSSMYIYVWVHMHTIYSLISNGVECHAKQNESMCRPQVMAKLYITMFDIVTSWASEELELHSGDCYHGFDL